MPQLSVDAWPIIERPEEQARARTSLHDPDCSGIAIFGAAGVGKSTLAGRIIEDAQGPVHRVTATTATTSIPLGALAPVLDQRSLAEAGTAALELATEQLTAAPGLSRPTLLVDDAHHLDDGSAHVLDRATQHGRVFVVLTIRQGMPLPEPLAGMIVDGRIERLDLGPLVDAEVDILLDAVLDGGRDDVADADLKQLSEGNPLLLRELVLSGIEAGRLHRLPTGWTITDPLAVAPRLETLVNSRLSGLRDADRLAVELTAVCEPVGLAVLRQVEGADLEALERAGLIKVVVSQRRHNVLIGHPLYGQVLRSGTRTLGSLALLRRTADAIAAWGARREPDALRLAAAMIEEGGGADPERLLAAARLARAAHDTDLAERLARTAVDHGGGSSATLMHGQLLLAQGRAEEAHRVLATAMTDGPDRGSMSGLARAAADASIWHLGRVDDARRAIAVGLEHTAPGPGRDDLLAAQASYDLLEGRPRDALTASQPLIDRPDRSVPETAMTTTIGALVLGGRLDEARGLVLRAERVNRDDSDPSASPSGQLLAARAFAQLLDDDLAGGRQLLIDGVARASDERRSVEWAWMAWALGVAELSTGRAGQARHWFARAEATATALAMKPMARWACAGQVTALASGGHVGAAASTLERLDEMGSDGLEMIEPEIIAAAAWMAAASGDLTDAEAILRAAGDHAQAHELPVLEIRARHDLVRLGRTEHAADRLEVLATQVQGRLLSAQAAHAAALAAGSGPGLTSVADEFEDLGAHLFAAEAFAQAGAIHAVRGEPRPASRANAASVVARGRCEDVATPALQGVGALVVLTRREDEVARLASGGMTSRQIGEHLGISARTVENHLQNAYAKLGVSARSALDAALTSGVAPT